MTSCVTTLTASVVGVVVLDLSREAKVAKGIAGRTSRWCWWWSHDTGYDGRLIAAMSVVLKLLLSLIAKLPLFLGG